ncbi:MAG: hypothetical protein KAV87_48975 [Desulfobacteraceae bacterium]|nr:hypothetical protein [Desulfobacteraceae bacterium]
MSSDNICRLCDIVNTNRERRKLEDTLLGETGNFEWIPGLGAFVEGYSLIVSKKHILNTGAFEISTIKELDVFVKKVRTILSNIYNTNTITIEHGSMGDSNYAGSCIEHQHLHIFPANIKDVPKILLKNFKKHMRIDSFEVLKKFNKEKVPYIYYSNTPSSHDVFEVSILPRQYLRQVIAAELQCADEWDWRQYPFVKNVSAFVKKVENLTLRG